MKKSFTWVWFMAAAACLYGCSNDDASEKEGVQCLDDQVLIDGVCQPKTDTGDENPCNPACKEYETCKNGECKPVEGTTDQCLEGQILVDGVCQDKPATGDENQCNPPCDEDSVCSNGECKPIEDEDSTGDSGTDTGDDDTDTQDKPYTFNVTPTEGLNTVTNSTVSFNLTLSKAPAKDVVIPLVNHNTKAGTISTDKIVFNADNWNSPQQVKVAGTKEILEDAVVSYTITVGPTESEDEHFNHLDAVEVQVSHYTIDSLATGAPKSLTLDKDKESLLLYGKPITIQATLDENATDKVIYWDIENTTDKVDWQHLVNANFDMNNHTITLQSNVVLNTADTQKYHLDYARTLKVTAKHASGLSASATVELKPYLPARGFTLTKLKDEVKDFVTPGHQLNKCVDDNDTNKCINESQGKYKRDSNVYNYTKGEMGCGYYDDHTAQVLTYDMFNDFVKPAMYKDEKGDLHGTRASVVAAARFLVVQFPKDIPYASAHLVTDTSLNGNYGNMAKPTVANFTWANNKNIEDETADDAKKKYRVFGLNLMSKAYNSFTTFTDKQVVLGGKGMKTVVPWGCAVPAADGKPVTKKTDNGTVDVPYPYNGLCCSGYVSWALRSGRFYLGNWPTLIFGQNGYCQDDKGNYVRNFRCRQFLGEKQKDSDTYKVSKDAPGTIANPKSKHEAAYAKMSMLKDEDFVKVSDLTVNSDIKAGDLLWYANYTCKTDNGTCLIDGNNCYEGGSGHVAMVLGVSRTGKKINKVYVSEAIHVNGNHLAAYTIDALKGSWKSTQTVKKNGTCKYKDARLIKMDRVYNYAHTKNPETVKEDLNTYNYSELWF